MKYRFWFPAAAAVLAAASLNGCLSPFSAADFDDRLERRGIPRPDRAVDRETPLPRSAEAESPADGITLRDLLRHAERVNPELRSSRLAVGVAAGRVWQAGLYPNPTAGVTSSEIGFDGDSSNTIVSVRQPIVIGNRLRAAVAAADADEAAKLADVERVRREVFGRVAELHARVLELDAQLTLVDELLALATQTLDIAEARFEARAVAEPDVIRPRVEFHQLRADRQRLARELAAAEKRLGLVLSTDPISADRLGSRISTTPEPIDKDQLSTAVEAGHPALVVADREIQAADATLDRIAAERVPDLDVTVGLGYSDESDQGIAEFGVGAEIPVWDRRQGDIMSARFDLMRRRQERAATRNRLLAELAEEVGAYDAARDQLAVIRDHVVPDAQRAFGQIDESYRAGRASFIDLLDAQRTLMQSRRTLIELAGRASVARARIAAVSGMDMLPGLHHSQSEHLPTKPITAPDRAEDHP